ncbi:MAG: peptide-methionine (S)-S-oxide reductase MsrA [Verrucomicrobiales bacterium]|nr:peptide-methionine (S)-S-oxide reductase MsrA [Verrucomicrobiales bacterium]
MQKLLFGRGLFALFAPMVMGGLVACSESPRMESTREVEEEEVSETPLAVTDDMKNEKSGQLELATFGGGCFWCTEAVMERLEGVNEVVSGYMGGHVENPTYEQVCEKTTGHAEVIQVSFDPQKISFSDLLEVFWQAHDPTTLNQQGNDHGPQYRSVIFYHSAEQRNLAEHSKAALDAVEIYSQPAVTEITEASTFWPAEEYHQDFYRQNKSSNPYCRIVISPKMKKLGLE